MSRRHSTRRTRLVPVTSLTCVAALCSNSCWGLLESESRPTSSKIRAAINDAIVVSYQDAQITPHCGQMDCPSYAPLCKDGKCISPNCDDLKDYCNDVRWLGTRVRSFCPFTCGCSSARSPLAVTDGCSLFCRRTFEYELRMRSTACEDIDVSDPGWQTFLDNVDLVQRTSFSDDIAVSIGPQVEALRQYGCAFLSDPRIMQQAFSKINGSVPPYQCARALHASMTPTLCSRLRASLAPTLSYNRFDWLIWQMGSTLVQKVAGTQASCPSLTGAQSRAAVAGGIRTALILVLRGTAVHLCVTPTEATPSSMEARWLDHLVHLCPTTRAPSA